MKRVLYIAIALGLCATAQAESSVSDDGGVIPPQECECPAMDAGGIDAEVMDAGTCVCVDASIPDSSMNQPDSSMNQPDSSVNQPDSSVHEPDGSSNKPDSSSGADAGPSVSGGGCSVARATSVGIAPLFAFGLLALRRRRRA